MLSVSLRFRELEKRVDDLEGSAGQKRQGASDGPTKASTVICNDGVVLV